MNVNQASKFKVHVFSKELMEMGPSRGANFFSPPKDITINKSKYSDLGSQSIPESPLPVQF